MRSWIAVMMMASLAGPLLFSTPPALSAPVASVPAAGGDAFAVALPQTGAPAGVTWVRVTADWSQLEPTKGSFAFAPLDAQVRRANDAHLNLVVMLVRTPQWAAFEPTAPQAVWNHQPPKAIGDWAAFVHQIVSRYGTKVSAYQVQTSLDLAEFRGSTKDYRGMLHAVRAEVQRTNPKALVVAAAPAGLDLPYVKTMLTEAGGDFDAMVLYPSGRGPAELLWALATIHTRLTPGRHQFWLDGGASSADPVEIAASALAGGVTLVFWPSLTEGLAAAQRLLGTAQFVGAPNLGPDTAVLVFKNGGAAVAVAWTAGDSRQIPLPTAGPAQIVAPPSSTGSTTVPVMPVGPSALAGTVAVGPAPVFVTNPDPSVVKDATAAAAEGPPLIPVPPDRNFSKAAEVSAQLGTTNVEHGLYNQRFRTERTGAVVPVTVDGQEAVRSDFSAGAVYVYFDVDNTYAYFDDGRYDMVITMQIHHASAAQRVGFNIMYDSMTGYRFTPWQWVDAGDGWGTYTVRLTDAAFSKTWGWDFAINAAADQKEPLVVRSVTVTRAPKTP